MSDLSHGAWEFCHLRVFDIPRPRIWPGLKKLMRDDGTPMHQKDGFAALKID